MPFCCFKLDSQYIKMLFAAGWHFKMFVKNCSSWIYFRPEQNSKFFIYLVCAQETSSTDDSDEKVWETNICGEEGNLL